MLLDSRAGARRGGLSFGYGRRGSLCCCCSRLIDASSSHPLELLQACVFFYFSFVFSKPSVTSALNVKASAPSVSSKPFARSPGRCLSLLLSSYPAIILQSQQASHLRRESVTPACLVQASSCFLSSCERTALIAGRDLRATCLLLEE